MAANKAQQKELVQLFSKYNKRLGKLYSQFVKRMCALGFQKEDLAKDALFNFDAFPEYRARLNDIFNQYWQESIQNYKDGLAEGVALSYAHESVNLSGFSMLSDKALRSARETAATAFISSRLHTSKGLDLSQSVWNYCQQGKSEFETAMANVIKDGLEKGTSAEELGRKVRQYLNNPDMMYRRYHELRTLSNGAKKDVVTWRRKVVGDDGKMHFIKEPLFKVGVGMYRSSRMNGLRLMRTEINMAYHTANSKRWKEEPCVIGVRVWGSPEHPKEDMCDELWGDYPKDFEFTGFHVQCMCAASAITCSKEELKDITRRRLAGEDMSKYVSPNAIKDVPQAFKDFVQQNHDKVAKAAERGKLNYILARNTKYWASLFNADELAKMGISTKETKVSHIVEIANARHVKRDAKAIQKLWNKRRFNLYFEKMLDANGGTFDDLSKASVRRSEKVFNAISKGKSVKEVETLYKRYENELKIQAAWNKRSITRHPALLKTYRTYEEVNKTFEAINAQLTEKWFENGDLKLALERKAFCNGSTDLKGNIFLKEDRLNNVMSALGKIGEQRVDRITRKEADAMATFWHEITHTSNKWGFVPMTSVQREYMELANEFVARHSLSEFYGKLGVKNIPYPEFQFSRASTGYNKMVTNYDYVIKRMGLDFDKVYNSARNHLFTAGYDDMETGLRQALLDGGLKYGSKRSKVKASDLKGLMRIIRKAGSHYEPSKEEYIDQWLTAHGFLI